MKRATASESLEIEGPVGPLDILVDARSSARAIAVICHPHPLQQGTMQNKVVYTLARTFYQLGAAAVRFNFRGVGRSGGVHAQGRGERDDLLAVVQWAARRWPGRDLYLGGFSFGAAVAMMEATRLEPRGLVTVAPPVERLEADFRQPHCPWLIVHGDRDEVVPLAAVRDWVATLEPGPTLVVLHEVGHFFHGQLKTLADRVAEFFTPALAAAEPADVERRHGGY